MVHRSLLSQFLATHRGLGAGRGEECAGAASLDSPLRPRFAPGHDGLPETAKDGAGERPGISCYLGAERRF